MIWVVLGIEGVGYWGGCWDDMPFFLEFKCCIWGLSLLYD